MSQKLNQNVTEGTSHMMREFENILKNSLIPLSSVPVVTTGVARKVNIGNFENTELFSALSLPLMSIPSSDEELRELVADRNRLGFDIVAEETYKRYLSIKKQIEAG